jgi:hypothetical protein
MIYASTSDDLRNFIREYKAGFDITLEDVMSSFLGMENEHKKRDLVTHLDTYIQETLAESRY